MDCNKCRELISEYIDESISERDKVHFEKHIEECMECRKTNDEIGELVNALESIQQVELPRDFSTQVIDQIKEGKGSKKMTFKRFLSYAAVLVCGIFITSMVFQLSSSRNTSDIAIGEASLSGRAIGGITAPEEAAQDKGTGVADAASTVKGEVTYNMVFDKDKIIYQGSVNLDVKDSEKSQNDIKKYIEANGGFVESSYMDNNAGIENQTYSSQSYILLRVPSTNFNATMEKLKTFGEVTSTSINSTNISTQYVDIQSEKESLEIQEERLLNYLKKAEKVEDMITIETELNRVRTNLNMIKTQLSNYDQSISYSNITVNLREAKTLTTTIKSPFGKLLDNISKGFISSINLLLQVISFLIVGVFRLIPFLIVIVPLGWGITKLIKRKRK